MNCDRALLALLEAELPELTTSASPLAEHVRNCARCHRVADRFLSDTRSLAVAMPASGVHQKRSTYSHAMAPLALAASLLVMVAVQRERRTPVVPVTATLPPVVIQPAAPVTHVEPVAVSPTPRRVTHEFPRAVPVAAVKLAGSASLTAGPPQATPTRTVSVTPPVGARAVVMQTSDPKLVVVWLY